MAPDDAKWWAAMHAATSRGDCGEVRHLGPEALAARDQEGRTVLHAAVAVLVDMGADTSATDACCKTPMDVAHEKGYGGRRARMKKETDRWTGENDGRTQKNDTGATGGTKGASLKSGWRRKNGLDGLIGTGL